MTNGYDAYRTTQTHTAEPLQLVILLYEGAIKFLRQAESAIGRKDVEQAHNCLIKAHRIVDELDSTLDKGRAPVGVALDEIYRFLLKEIERANLSKNAAVAREVADMLSALLEGWRMVAAVQGAQPGRAAA